MLELNHILLFIAVVSPLILLARIARLRNPRNRGWCIAALIVLAICAVAWLVARPFAGFVGGTFWCLLLLVPSLAERKIDDLFLVQNFGRARRLAVVRRILHPWEDTPHRPSLLSALEQAAHGRLDRALDQLAAERARSTPASRFASALTFALTENWAGLVQWCRRDPALATNPAIYSLYLRALGETRDLDDLVYDLGSRVTTRDRSLSLRSPFGFPLLLALAFCGRTKQLGRLLSDHFPQMPLEHREFWIATAELAEGRGAPTRARLEKLRATTKDALLSRSIDRRLASAQRPTPLSSSAEALLTRLVEAAAVASQAGPRPVGAEPAVWGLILLNIAMFGVEVLLGGATNSRTLQFLGALEPDAVIVRHEFWRMLTALFLHYGALHLSINLFALYILGPPLEHTIGSRMFALCYLLGGLGSSAGVLLLWTLNLTNANQLVGASGCIMAVIGISAGLLLRHRRSAWAGRELQMIIVIVAIQTAFDLWTPQVSLAAHLSGFIAGLGIGALLASRRSRVPE